MNLEEKAKLFAIKAHEGQVRKSEPEKPMVFHPIAVGRLLKEYHADEAMVAAGYLHDVVEDTDYTIEDIRKEFGDDVADLVETASEPDKSLSWEERKQHTIDDIKNKPLRNKLIVCADKVNNLEDLKNMFDRNGDTDFSSFKKGYVDQNWYYDNVYQSLIFGENENHPLFIRYRNALDALFYNQRKGSYLKEVIFDNNLEDYDRLHKLHAQKVELRRLRDLVDTRTPYVIEFTGTPRTGKTSFINNLYDFFKKGGFSVSMIEEFTTSEYYRCVFKKEMEDLSKYELNTAIAKEVEEQLLKRQNHGGDIILVDRSLFDRTVWMKKLYTSGGMTEQEYYTYLHHYKERMKKSINAIVMMYANPFIALKRDYHNSLALEERSFLNFENIDEYNKALLACGNELEDLGNIVKVYTDNSNQKDVAIEATGKILTMMRSHYIDKAHNEIKAKKS